MKKTHYKILSITMPEQLLKVVKANAEKQGISVSEYIRYRLSQQIDVDKIVEHVLNKMKEMEVE